MREGYSFRVLTVIDKLFIMLFEWKCVFYCANMVRHMAKNFRRYFFAAPGTCILYIMYSKYLHLRCQTFYCTVVLHVNVRIDDVVTEQEIEPMLMSRAKFNFVRRLSWSISSNFVK